MINYFNLILHPILEHICNLFFKYSNSYFAFDRVTGKPLFFQELFSLARYML